MLRPTFMGFETAKRGLTTAQKGLDIAGQNLTNWDSAGYTRQRITQVAVAPDSFRSRYSTSRAGLAGQGVDITGIGQTRDVFLDKRFREENSDMGYYGQSTSILGDIQTALNEFNPDKDVGLRSRLLAINDALQKFSVNAYSETHANIVATEFKNLAQTLQQISSKLQNSREQQIFDLDVSVMEINKKLQRVADLNQAIMDDAAYIQSNPYFGPNELYDERNLLLDELSNYMDMDYTRNVDGTVTVMVNGQTVVDGNKFDKMEMVQDEKSGVVDVRWVSSGKSANLKSGSIKATTDYINGRGPNLKNPGESNARGYLYYKDKLDAFAQTFASVVNRVIPEVDEDGKPKLDDDGNIIYRQLMGGLSSTPDPDDGKYHVRTDIPITADNLSISDEWSTNSGYVIYQRGEDGSADDVNNYALSLYQILADGTHLFDSNGEEMNGTMLDYIKGYATTLAEDVSFNDSRHVSTSSIAQSLEDNRDEVAGVVVDEEVANVMLYQKTLAAASRLMTAMDEALDTLINKTGLVGR